MNLSQQQLNTKDKIIQMAKVFGLDSVWVASIAMAESSLGKNQLSHTFCKGVFQMSSIAMKDLLQEMGRQDDDLIDIACGVAFLYLLLRRHKTIENATGHFCDPNDIKFYIPKVLDYMKVFKDAQI
jgi:hypothetical protein